MRRSAPLLALGIAAGAAFGLAAPREEAPFTPPKAKEARPLRDFTFTRTPERLARGMKLTEAALQCFLCHSDRDWTLAGAPPIKKLKGAGHVFWEERDGTRLVAPNITPDRETGAGRWTDDMLARAIREGVGHDERPLHPQMWYGAFHNLSDEDVASVVVAIRALPPVRRKLPQTRLRPERYATLERGVPSMRISEPVGEPDPRDPVAYGRYLVRIADCQGCHTAWEAPLNPGLFGGGNHIELERGAGGKRMEIFSRNITPDASGISYYDDALFREVMRTGKVRAREISPLMPWIALGRLSDADLSAMFAFLKTVPKVAHVVDAAEANVPCAMCGQTHGGGRYNKPKDAGAVALEPATARAIAGTYRYEDGFVFQIHGEKGRLVAGEPGGPASEVFTKDRKLFLVKRDVSVLEFTRDAGGRVTGLIDHGFFDARATKVK